MRSVLLYTLARLAIFAATVGVLWPLMSHGIGLVFVALIVSGIVSFVLLSSQRDRMSAAVVTGFRDRRRKLEESRTREDA
ncbi:DUF4229 domain-containing protein [Actinomadura roseirufa]|uniref:DUF4229 domain-containing protein n=1 Tax=Actinomadura roseirufa TaxID=2094049 RepID=UPI0013F16F53|nr:DUF4229 domain-containing protein [Actinomadura roseirufa]